MAPRRPFVIVAALIALVYLADWFSFFDHNLLDARAQVWPRPVSGDLVVVAIDSTSLRALAQWPWPRRYHAEAIRRLIDAGAARIAYDIVLSSPSTAEDDAILAGALAVAGPARVALPVFRQLRQTEDGRIVSFDTAPLQRFLRHVTPASINVQPDADGLVRRVRGMTEWIQAWAARGWKRKTGAIENEQLWRALAEAAAGHEIEWRWVRGHAGHPQNEYANHLATRAARTQTASNGLVPSGFGSWLEEQREKRQRYMEFNEWAEPPAERFQPARRVQA